MLELRRDHRWRGASLAAATTLLALCLILLVGLGAVAQEKVDPLTEVTSPGSIQVDGEHDLAVHTWKIQESSHALPGGVFYYGIFYANQEGA
ncbi:MAG: hypothetical protein PVH59_13795, partial [Anaerolineae bacterium]